MYSTWNNKLRCINRIVEGHIIRLKDTNENYHLFRVNKCEKVENNEFEVTLIKFEF